MTETPPEDPAVPEDADEEAEGQAEETPEGGTEDMPALEDPDDGPAED